MSSTGTCALCDKPFQKTGMSRHLRACLPRHDEPGPAPRRLFHVRVEQPYRGAPYFLDLEVDETVELGDLDALLRHLWLECCGHLSAFRLGRYGELDMEMSVAEAMEVAEGRMDYEYDFGTTTRLVVRLAGQRRGTGEDRVRIVARNDPPELSCLTCGEPATQICSYCMDDDYVYCDEHVREQRCWDDDGFLPVVNSPRMGVCGYTGD